MPLPQGKGLRSVNRRDIISAILNFSWTVPLGMSLIALFKFLRYEPPRAISTRLVLGTPQSVPQLPAYLEIGQVWLNRDDGGFYAVDAICTHLGCTIRSNPDDGGYLCRCHGSRFTAEGAVLHGPATKPLHFFKLSWNESQQMVVDKAAEVDPSFRLPPA